MKQGWELTEEAFNRLLDWLAPDRETAGQRYEEIRLRLIKIFASRGCQMPEDLADETINRVSAKLSEIASTYEGDQALYFYGIANFVFRESIKAGKPAPPPPPPPMPDPNSERAAHCLEHCLGQLSPPQRQLILAYYEFEKRAKIECRRHLAEQHGLSDNALKIRVHRLRQQLYDCLQNCLEAEELKRKR